MQVVLGRFSKPSSWRRRFRGDGFGIRSPGLNRWVCWILEVL